MKKIVILFFISCCFSYLFSSIVIATASDEEGSQVAYKVIYEDLTIFNLESKCKQLLVDEGYRRAKVTSHTGNEGKGHHLNSGYYVVVKGTWKRDGIEKVSYGMGADANSYSTAEARALKNMEDYSGGYGNYKSDSYTIVEKRSFSCPSSQNPKQSIKQSQASNQTSKNDNSNNYMKQWYEQQQQINEQQRIQNEQINRKKIEYADRETKRIYEATERKLKALTQTTNALNNMIDQMFSHPQPLITTSTTIYATTPEEVQREYNDKISDILNQSHEQENAVYRKYSDPERTEQKAQELIDQGHTPLTGAIQHMAEAYAELNRVKQEKENALAALSRERDQQLNSIKNDIMEKYQEEIEKFDELAAKSVSDTEFQYYYAVAEFYKKEYERLDNITEYENRIVSFKPDREFPKNNFKPRFKGSDDAKKVLFAKDKIKLSKSQRKYEDEYISSAKKILNGAIYENNMNIEAYKTLAEFETPLNSYLYSVKIYNKLKTKKAEQFLKDSHVRLKQEMQKAILNNDVNYLTKLQKYNLLESYSSQDQIFYALTYDSAKSFKYIFETLYPSKKFEFFNYSIIQNKSNIFNYLISKKPSLSDEVYKNVLISENVNFYKSIMSNYPDSDIFDIANRIIKKNHDLSELIAGFLLMVSYDDKSITDMRKSLMLDKNSYLYYYDSNTIVVHAVRNRRKNEIDLFREFGADIEQAEFTVEKQDFDTCSTKDDFKNFLAKYPDGKLFSEATTRYQDLTRKYEDELFSNFRGLTTNYKNYLKEFPMGRYSSKARSGLRNNYLWGESRTKPLHLFLFNYTPDCYKFEYKYLGNKGFKSSFMYEDSEYVEAYYWAILGFDYSFKYTTGVLIGAELGLMYIADGGVKQKLQDEFELIPIDDELSYNSNCGFFGLNIGYIRHIGNFSLILNSTGQFIYLKIPTIIGDEANTYFRILSTIGVGFNF